MIALQAIEFGAVVAFAICGILLASRKQMDFVGLFAVASAVAFGGGTIRDLCLDRTPLFWIENSYYTIVVFGLALIGALAPQLMLRLEKYLALPDALGLGLFTVVGTGYALELGTPLFVSALIGVMTGAFGGVIADVICNELPSIFRPAPLYASCSFAGAWVYIAGVEWGWEPSPTLALSLGTVVFFRLASIKWNWRLPSVNHPGND
jgi:uncharacterized membrane protein YeiH